LRTELERTGTALPSTVRLSLAGAIATLVAGIGLIAFSVAEGQASLALLLIFPVLSGSSLPFLGGVVLLILGFITLPIGLAEGWEEPSTSPGALSSSSQNHSEGGAGGGLVLIGPFPILFGSWRGVSRRTRRWLALFGAVSVIAVFVAVALVFR